jgi:hypothetical protein
MKDSQVGPHVWQTFICGLTILSGYIGRRPVPDDWWLSETWGNRLLEEKDAWRWSRCTARLGDIWEIAPS